MLLIKLAENLSMVGHSPTHMHIIVVEWFANIVTPKSTPKITLIWGLKVLDMCQLVINPNMAILV
jgi:hypothetical protein